MEKLKEIIVDILSDGDIWSIEEIISACYTRGVKTSFNKTLSILQELAKTTKYVKRVGEYDYQLWNDSGRGIVEYIDEILKQCEVEIARVKELLYYLEPSESTFEVNDLVALRIYEQLCVDALEMLKKKPRDP